MSISGFSGGFYQGWALSPRGRKALVLLFSCLLLLLQPVDRAEPAAAALLVLLAGLDVLALVRSERCGDKSQMVTCGQISDLAELGFVSVLIYMTGGLTSSMVLLYPVVLISSAAQPRKASGFAQIGLFGHLFYAAAIYFRQGSFDFYLTAGFWKVCLAVAASYLLAIVIMSSINSKNLQLAANVRRINELNLKLYEKNRELDRLAYTDFLTGLYNHRFFHETLEEKVQQALKADIPLSLVLIDVDYFKKYNDANGHLAGDRLLKELGRLIASNIRKKDILCRYGGEEFVIILPNTNEAEALRQAQRVVRLVEEHDFEYGESQPGGRLTVTAGVASYPGTVKDPSELLKVADEFLYRNKEAKDPGRQFLNRILSELDLDSSEDNAILKSFGLLLAVVNAKDMYTYGHSERVAECADRIAARMGWSDEERRRLRFASFLHDIGKVEVPAGILNKAGPLSNFERQQVQGHSEMGAKILERISVFSELAPVVRAHHEHYDGGGYPDGKKGPDIPGMARILAVADAVDAMLTNRPYRKALSYDEVVAELKRGSGRQFDPEAMAACLAVLEDMKEKGQIRMVS